jgi:Ca2+-binding EF-hand superfamily protein
MDFTLNTFRSIRQAALVSLAFAMMATHAVADNKSALKDAIGNSAKVIETQPTEIKLTDKLAKVTPETEFKKLDTNNDEKISLKEATKDKALATQFDASDINHDGVISVDEFAFYRSNAGNTQETVPADATIN